MPNSNTDAALEVSDQTEFILTAPIAEVAENYGMSIDEAVNMRVAAALNNAPPKLDVTVRPIDPKGNLLGYATLKFNDSFVVEDIRVLQSDKGIFIGMPSKPDGKNGYRDTAKPITAAFRSEIIGAVTEAYNTAIEKLQSRAAMAAEKPSMKEQLENGAAKAAKENAARPAPAKAVKSAERG